MASFRPGRHVHTLVLAQTTHPLIRVEHQAFRGKAHVRAASVPRHGPRPTTSRPTNERALARDIRPPHEPQQNGNAVASIARALTGDLSCKSKDLSPGGDRALSAAPRTAFCRRREQNAHAERGVATTCAASARWRSGRAAVRRHRVGVGRLEVVAEAVARRVAERPISGCNTIARPERIPALRHRHYRRCSRRGRVELA